MGAHEHKLAIFRGLIKFKAIHKKFGVFWFF